MCVDFYPKLSETLLRYNKQETFLIVSNNRECLLYKDILKTTIV